jgi:hypothetical protein
MGLKETFLNYVERQRSANAVKDQYGAHHQETGKAYAVANEYKRKVLDEIERIEDGSK